MNAKFFVIIIILIIIAVITITGFNNKNSPFKDNFKGTSQEKIQDKNKIKNNLRLAKRI